MTIGAARPHNLTTIRKKCRGQKSGSIRVRTHATIYILELAWLVGIYVAILFVFAAIVQRRALYALNLCGAQVNILEGLAVGAFHQVVNF